MSLACESDKHFGGEYFWVFLKNTFTVRKRWVMISLGDHMTEEHAQNAIHSAATNKYLTFGLGNESYGIAVLKVREIIKMQEVTMVPQMPEYIQGVINLRGKIIPVIDLRIKFGLDRAEHTDSTCIIVVNTTNVEGMQTQLGLIVDGVEEVLNIADSEIENPPNFGEVVEAGYIIGMAKIKGAVKTLLDIDKVVGAEAIVDMKAVTGGSQV
jgi:purine-binding chemotaxis protein CheW